MSYKTNATPRPKTIVRKRDSAISRAPPEGERIDSKTRLVLWKDDYLSSIQFPFHNTASTETEH